MKPALATLLLLASCGPTTPAPIAEPTENPKIAAAQLAVLARLRDPGSAKFGPFTVTERGIVCGSVNARNGFNGYSGTSAFWFDPQSKEAYIATESQDSWGKQYDAELFQKKGCPSGLERMLNL